MVLWSLRQMIGITHGLRIIHNFKVSIPLSVAEMEMETPRGKAKMSVSSGEERYGRHGDLKPENILWFEDAAGAICQITDFGLGRFHGRDTRTKAAPYTIWSSPTYEPPECHIYLPVSRAYDLWSLGCLFLEWVSWMLNGWQAIDDFSRSRVEQSFIMNKDGMISDDYFWTLVVDKNNRNARVRNGVEQWVLMLRAHPKCSQLIHEILNLIMQDLLCIVPSRRCNAATLHNNLVSLISRAESDYEYVLKPCPWVPKASVIQHRHSINAIATADSGNSVFFLMRRGTWPPSQLHKHQMGKRNRHLSDATHTTSSHVVKSRRRSRRASDLWQRVFNGIDSGALRDALLNPGKPIDGLDSQVNFRYGRYVMTS
ncbi:Serine/threonine-protein kinase H1-like protein [Lasiodiplodia hormozganensis]|uniref:Serine/threonine-protein kinase H1-like protein n=1 Tax=Lasiodiplodia hormozganensis TaxID=869390 RepID=A0AA40CI09_9PEZI|nr:Serine/threonine-protein kinase H1-like protein [Lasiodiplodia hormozganensis]